jgi:predicted transcriptional regulator|tara:strand:+ start:401 stop:1207 length:807 start_codon:yes stop_codon:yes gene_type:complete
MAVPNTKATLKEYCLRSLGKPVIDINVDEDQIDDRIDEAIQYFAQYHVDGVERMYLKYLVTEADITRMTTDSTESITDNSVTTSWKTSNNFLVVPSSVISVVNIFSLSDRANLNIFDVRYQLRLNDLYDFSSTSIVHYEMTMRHLDFLDHILVGEKPIRFNQLSNKLFIDMDWKTDITAGEHLIFEVYRELDPDTHTDMYDDLYLKRYATTLIKRQWGQNLSKFSGTAMLGGVTLNGPELFSTAIAEQQRLEEEIRSNYEEPAHMQQG